MIEIFFLKKNTSFKDASDNVQFFILIGLLFGVYSPGLATIFISIIMIFVYHIMGVFKFKSDIWRSGEAILNVMSTEAFGKSFFANMFNKNSLFKKLISWGTIFFQVTFPLCILDHRICIIYLICGFLFHLSIMYIMKLHNFFWVFISTYPCLYIVSLKSEKYVQLFFSDFLY